MRLSFTSASSCWKVTPTFYWHMLVWQYVIIKFCWWLREVTLAVSNPQWGCEIAAGAKNSVNGLCLSWGRHENVCRLARVLTPAEKKNLVIEINMVISTFCQCCLLKDCKAWPCPISACDFNKNNACTNLIYLFAVWSIYILCIWLLFIKYCQGLQDTEFCGERYNKLS